MVSIEKSLFRGGKDLLWVELRVIDEKGKIPTLIYTVNIYRRQLKILENQKSIANLHAYAGRREEESDQ